MKLREMDVTVWVAVGVTLVVVAALGVTFLSERSPIRADDPEPTATATSTQAVGAMPAGFPTPLPDPPCYEEFERKYGQYTFLMIGTGETNCVLYGPGGDIISEAEAFLLIAEWERKKAQAAQNAAASVDPWFSVRSITLADGRVIHLPADVRIADVWYPMISCTMGSDCPKIPLYKLVRGDKVVWIDAEGYVINFDGDESEPGGFQIPGILDIRR